MPPLLICHIIAALILFPCITQLLKMFLAFNYYHLTSLVVTRVRQISQTQTFGICKAGILQLACIIQPNSISRAVLMGCQRGARPQSEVGTQVKFLMSENGYLGWKNCDYMLVLCQKLHICSYDWQNFSGDSPPPETPPFPKVELLELPLSIGAIKTCHDITYLYFWKTSLSEGLEARGTWLRLSYLPIKWMGH